MGYALVVIFMLASGEPAAMPAKWFPTVEACEYVRAQVPSFIKEQNENVEDKIVGFGAQCVAISPLLAV